MGYGCADTGLHRLDSSFLRFLVQSGDPAVQQGVVLGVMGNGTVSDITFAFSSRVAFDVLARCPCNLLCRDENASVLADNCCSDAHRFPRRSLPRIQLHHVGNALCVHAAVSWPTF